MKENQTRGDCWKEADMGSTFWKRMLTYGILVCMCLTLPTVWHPLTTSWSATVPIPALRFLFFSLLLLSTTTPPPPHAPPHSSLQLVIVLLFAYSVSLCFWYILSHSLPHFYLLSMHFILIYSLSHCCPPSAFSLSVLTPWGKWSYVNCFLLDVHSAWYPSILMNSFPPFTPKSSNCCQSNHKKHQGPNFLSCFCLFFLFLCT